MKDYFIEECWSGDKYLWLREEYGLGSYRWRQTHAMGIGNTHWEVLGYADEPAQVHPVNLRRLEPEEVFIQLL